MALSSLRLRSLASILVVLVLAACGQAVSDEHVIEEPASFENGRITMTTGAEERLGIQTTDVIARGVTLIVPSSALIVDPKGVFWVYTSPDRSVFIRERVRIARDEGSRAFLTHGPAAGTQVVTVGVPELYGIETGVGH